MPPTIDAERSARASPWTFVPALYFLQGVPYFVVNTATTTFFSALKVPLSDIGHSAGLATLPWTLKPLWSPAVDLLGTKRAWTVGMQVLIIAAIASLAFAATSSHVVLWTVVACLTVATASATHDVAADGFYLLALDGPSQAGFVGVRNAFHRLSRIFVTGAVVYAIGEIEEGGVERPRAWAIGFGATAAVYALGVLWCAAMLPRPAADGARAERSRGLFLEALASYFRRENLGPVLAFILLYRFGELMLTTMATPFLQASRADGGMGLSTKDVGLWSGTVGIAALIAGGVLGGWWISRAGLKRCLWPMAIAMHVPNAFYAWAAFAQPGEAAVAAVIATEQIAYGFGFAAYMVVLMRISQRGAYPTTHYAISTGIMGLSTIVASWISGDLAAALGFPGFFLVVCACAVPSLLPIFFLRLADEPAPA